ncbi:hypothetical protein SAMD00023353_7700520 [Rosellinia necatrix]|uniref:Secreted protein n=1 Tax=Rosellinia necatrix TaxID=77044 RepID=A0A1S8ABU6_ROSNE|nr:hypothetical protein SAMD00023353_7700520 [Rosellinia necatrix]
MIAVVFAFADVAVCAGRAGFGSCGGRRNPEAETSRAGEGVSVAIPWPFETAVTPGLDTRETREAEMEET